MYETIKYKEDKYIARILLNRPETKNAINYKMIAELTDAFMMLKKKEEIRLVTLSGTGTTFCSGADLHWLREVKDYDYDENYNESMKLVKLLKLINDHPKPVICKVNGSAVGGGVGLMLASDIVIAADFAKFGLSEVGIGLVPAAIVPMLLNRIGNSRTREFIITGNRLNANEALNIGLVNYNVNRLELDELCEKFEQKIINNGKNAISKAKEMINKLNPSVINEETADYIAKIIAELRTSEEGLEGISSFLEKRKPNWVAKDKDQ